MPVVPLIECEESDRKVALMRELVEEAVGVVLVLDRV